MKKFALSLIVLCSLAAPVLAEQDPPLLSRTPALSRTPSSRRSSRASITRSLRAPTCAATRSNPRRTVRSRASRRRQIDQRQANSLRDLIDQQLLLQKAAELGISADAEMVKRLDELRKQMKASSMEDLQKMAESQGVSWEEFKQNTKNGILTQKVIGSEVGSRIQITRDELQKFYDAHQSEIAQPERVRLSEILIANDPNAPKGAPLEPTPEQVAAAQAKANEIYQQLKDGAKFDELARKESNGSTADQGGDLGYFKRNDLAKELEDQSFALKAGEFTQPIRTRQGFIILRVDDRIEAGTPPLDRIRDQIQDQIYSLKMPARPARLPHQTARRGLHRHQARLHRQRRQPQPDQAGLCLRHPVPRPSRCAANLAWERRRPSWSPAGTRTPSDRRQHLGTRLRQGRSRCQAEGHRRPQGRRGRRHAKAAADAAEKEKLSHMSPKERSKYLAQKKREEKKEAKLRHQEKVKQKEAAENEARDARPTKPKPPKVRQKVRESRARRHQRQAEADARRQAIRPHSVPAKTDADAKAKAASDRKAAEDAAKAKADADAAEKAKLNHMTRKERADYLAKKKQDAKEAKKEAAKNGDTSATAAPADTSQQADARTKKKKSISWF